tara:strand:- start:114 stop:509 length:396 start_codon:yes stop_codon:yes gene_type:complete
MSQSTMDDGPTEPQINFLRGKKLKYTGELPKTKKEASQLIQELCDKEGIPRKSNSSYTPRAAPVEEPSIVHEEATEEDLKYAESLLKTAAKFHRLAVTAVKKRGEPLRGDIINAERNFLLKVEKLRSCNNS